MGIGERGGGVPVVIEHEVRELGAKAGWDRPAEAVLSQVKHLQRGGGR